MADYYLPLGLVDANGVTESPATVVSNWIDANVPNGTDTAWNRVYLKPQALTQAIYCLNDILKITGRRYLIIDATSVTIRRDTTPTTRDHPIVALIGCRDLWWYRGRIIGEAINPGPHAVHEADPGMQFRNCKDVQVSQIAIADNTGQSRSVWGDFFWFDSRKTGDPADAVGIAGTSERVWVHDSTCNRSGRMGIAVERVVNLVVERITFNNVGRTLIDAEPTQDIWQAHHNWFLDCTTDAGLRPSFALYSSGSAADNPNIHDVVVRGWTLTGRQLVLFVGGLGAAAVRSSNFIFEDLSSNMSAGPGEWPIRINKVDNLKLRGLKAQKKYLGQATPNHPEYVQIADCTNISAPPWNDPGGSGPGNPGNDFRPDGTTYGIMRFGATQPTNYAAHIAAAIPLGSFVDFDLPRPDIEGRVIAADGTGSWGQPPSVVTTAPAAPTGLTATPTATQIALNWNDAADANQWQVFRRNLDTTWPTVPTAVRVTSDWTDVGIPDATLRFYRVYAFNTTTGLTSLTYAETSATTPSVAPNPPTDVATGSDTTSITVSWGPRPLSEGVVNYRVYRSLNGTTGWAEIAEVDEFTISYQDTPLAVGSLRYYYVTAVDGDDDESVASAVVNDTVQAVAPPSYYIPLAEVGTARVGGPDRIGGLARDREFAAADTLTYGITDAKTGLVSSSVRADTLTVGVTETKATLVLLSRSDTLTVGVTDVKTGLVGTSTRTDTLTAGITDATSALVGSSSRSDTLTAGITDAATIASTSALTDTLTVGISDQSSVAFDVELLVASDTLTVGITDAATDVIVGLDATDTPTVGITDAVSTLVSSSDVVDELTVGADEATVHVDGTMATSDELTVGIDDQTVAGDAIMLDVTDTLSVAIDESSILETQGGPNDDLILEIVEAASIIATVVTGDTFAMSAGDMVVARSLVSDPLPDETVDLILA